MLLTTCMVDFFFCNIGLTSCITAKQTTTISNPTCPEEKAEELRAAYARFMAKESGK